MLLVIIENHISSSHHLAVACSHRYKSYVVCIYRGTKQRHHHGDIGITVMGFTVVKNIEKQRNVKLFHR